MDPGKDDQAFRRRTEEPWLEMSEVDGVGVKAESKTPLPAHLLRGFFSGSSASVGGRILNAFVDGLRSYETSGFSTSLS